MESIASTQCQSRNQLCDIDPKKKSRFLVKTLLKWYPPIALMIPDIFQMVCNAIGKYETPSLHTASTDDLYT